MDTQLTLGTVNKATYARADVVKYYRTVNELLPAERVLFDKLLPVIKDARILDIGVGGGRSTGHLLTLTSDYTGIDYVAEFAEATARKYPEAKILCGDATNMKEFADNSFDFALFSYNGIDSISHAERLKALSEIHRVLRPGGTLMFSSHNRDYEYFNKQPWQRKIHWERRYLIFLLHCLYHFPKHLRMKKHEIYTDDYAIVNDGDHRYSLLLYYISIRKQVRQLTALGFENIRSYDTAGDEVSADTSSHWIHYLATKR